MRAQQRPSEPPLLAAWGPKWQKKLDDDPEAEHHWRRIPKSWLTANPQDNAKADPADTTAPTLYDCLILVLRCMNSGHCSFCDAFPVRGISRETIEHFRPKSAPHGRPLAYAWSNLYYACDCCQEQKGSDWRDELIAPDSTSYQQRGFAHYFDCKRDGRIVPNPFAPADALRTAQALIDLYGLNNENRPTVRVREKRKWLGLGQPYHQLDTSDIETGWAYRDFITFGDPTA